MNDETLKSIKKYSSKFSSIEAMQLTNQTMQNMKEWVGDTYAWSGSWIDCWLDFKINHEIIKIKKFDYLIKLGENNFIVLREHIFNALFKEGK